MKLKLKIMSSAVLLSACCSVMNLNVFARGDLSKNFSLSSSAGENSLEYDYLSIRLYHAITRGNLRSVQDIIEYEAENEDERKSYGQRALVMAASIGDIDIVKYIVENGYFESLETWEDGPLFSAVEHYRFNVIDYLLSQGFRFVYPWWYGRDKAGQSAKLSDLFSNYADRWDLFEIDDIFTKYGCN